MGSARILVGDVKVRLGEMGDGSVDSIVTDPPYELGFMGKSWDSSGIANDAEMWRECLRVLKPGGYLLSFGGSRTYHRMACAIEDAGFEIRDQIMWLYGSGFPKSLDVSKAIDKAERGVPQGGADPTSENHGKYKSGCSDENPSGRGFGAGPGQFMKDSRSKYDGANRKPAPSTSEGFGYESKGGLTDSQPLTDAAKQWSGWGTALKPAHEPVCVARKRIVGMVAANVLEHGTGALNIDGCRIGVEERTYSGSGPHLTKLENHGKGDTGIGMMDGSGKDLEFTVTGRWPANVIHDGSEEVVSLFPESASGKSNVKGVTGSDRGGNTGSAYGAESRPAGTEMIAYGDKGSAARFFYTAKASRDDRGDGNNHPTVKPIDLMRYLVRLVTPPGGLVLDCFMGSGTTGIAALLEGFDFIGIELNPSYAALAEKRISAAAPLLNTVEVVG